MAQKTTAVNRIVTEYATSLRPQIRIDGVFLFGSYARGEAKGDSDIDLIVLSHDFSKMEFLKRLQLLNKLRKGAALTVPMDILGFTPQEFLTFKKSESPNLRQLYKEARRIYP